MAMRTATPWWLSVVMAVGLFFIFLGERAFAHAGGAATVLTYLGAFLVVASTAVRAVGFARSRGKRRRVELILLACHIGVLVSLAIFFFSPDYSSISGMDPKKAAHAETMVTITWTVLMLASLMPMIMAEVALGISNRGELALTASDNDEDASVNSYRVSSMATSGLTIALALSFLMATCNYASQKNIRKDVSYFRTSSPGSATVAMVANTSQPLKALLFFPDVNEVKDEVKGYFDSLARKGHNLTVEVHDRYRDQDLAEKYKVSKDGTVVLVRETNDDAAPPAGADDKAKEAAEAGKEKTDSFTVDTDMDKARRNQLRTLDGTVQKSLMKVIRDKMVVYMTVGHGEINDPGSVGALAAKNPDAQAQIIKTILSRLNYQVKNLARDQLTVDVPDDADVVLVMGPRAPLMDAELDALDRYLARGGSLMVALDPQSKADLGMLSGRLGVTWNGTPLADDSRPLRMRRSIADNMVILAKDFSSHSSVTTLSRVGSREGGLPFIIAGSFVDAPFERMADSKKKPKRTYIITSPKTTFRDLNKNFKFDKDTEKRQAYNLAVAVEDPAATGEAPPEGKEKQIDKTGMRALLFGDVELFIDQIQGRALIAQVAFADAVKWLSGEEIYAGETVSEKDVRIKHTRARDAKWFYGTIVGAPLLILGLGLVVGSRSGRRRSKARKS